MHLNNCNWLALVEFVILLLFLDCVYILPGLTVTVNGGVVWSGFGKMVPLSVEKKVKSLLVIYSDIPLVSLMNFEIPLLLRIYSELWSNYTKRQ